MAENAFINNALSALVKKAAPAVRTAIHAASAGTGIDFAYLMQQAKVESDFQPDLKAKTSSATGLFQFLDKTWLQMVEKHGAQHGMADLADKTDDPAFRDKILALRNDPQKAAAMAAEFASDNRDYLLKNTSLKRNEIGPTELYLAHFMGAGGAANFISAMRDNPLQTAADLMPEAAMANRNVFYDKDTGAPRTLAGVYDFFDKKFAIKPGATTADQPQTPLRVSPGSLPSVPFSGAAGRVSSMTMSAADAVKQMTALMSAQDKALIALLSGGGGSGNDDDEDQGQTFLKSVSSSLARGGLMQNPVDLMVMAQKAALL